MSFVGCTAPTRRRLLPIAPNAASAELNHGIHVLRELGVEHSRLGGSMRNGRRLRLSLIEPGNGNDESLPASTTHGDTGTLCDPWERGPLTDVEIEYAAAQAEVGPNYEHLSQIPWDTDDSSESADPSAKQPVPAGAAPNKGGEVDPWDF